MTRITALAAGHLPTRPPLAPTAKINNDQRHWTSMIISLKRFDWARADAAAKGISADATWVEVVLKMRVDDSVANRMLPIAFETQRHVSLRMASHLKGVAQNLRRSVWISAGMLDHDPAQVNEPIGAQLDRFLV